MAFFLEGLVPTASTSSMRSISGFVAVALRKQVLYTSTGEILELHFLESLKLGKFKDIIELTLYLFLRHPITAPYNLTFSCAVSSGWNPTPNSKKGAIFPKAFTFPVSG